MSSTHLQAAVRLQKKALRDAVSHRLRQLSPQSITEQSQAITDRILSLPSFKSCKSISCYINMPSGEATTDDIVHEILSSGKKLYVPKIRPTEGTMDFLRVYSADDIASFPAGKWGIREPGELWGEQRRESILRSPAETLDMILLPGVAFDRGLSRLGHGKGYYDRFISAYTSSGRSKPLLVGIGLNEQLLDMNQVPVVDHDWRLDVLVTPRETIVREDVTDEQTENSK
ncbi:5-formyltetrahydrofolate cyclo-ligase [Agrocybe pediades]|nr:5-formyltetrahydrofolate cyclo-ligase [Agrocybe pediades]